MSEFSDKNILKNLKIKTNSVTRCMKDITFTDKEIDAQRKRIQTVKDDPEKDEHDAKKQEEVLDEYLAAKPDEKGRLAEFVKTLREYLAEIAEHVSDDVKATEQWTLAANVLKEGDDKVEELDKQDLSAGHQ